MTSAVTKKRQKSAPLPPQRRPLVEKQNGDVIHDENMNGEVDENLEMTVVLPNGDQKMMTVNRKTHIMDFQLKVIVSNKLNPSGYTLQAFSEESNKPITYQPSHTLETLGVTTVYLVSKKADKEKRSSLTGSFEKTQRLQVNMPGNQRAVFRVNPQSSISDIYKHICSEKNIDMPKYELRLPANHNEGLNQACRLQEYNVTELNLVKVETSNLRISEPHHKSLGDLNSDSHSQRMSVHQPSDDLGLRDQKKKRGFFSFLKKEKKFKLMDFESTSLPRPQKQQLSTAPPSEDIHSQTLPRPVRKSEAELELELELSIKTSEVDPQLSEPVKPQRKKRAPAPAPPALRKITTSPPQVSVHPTDENVGQSPQQISEIDFNKKMDHSRNSSDSSGYHEASTVSPTESPESDHSLFSKSSLDSSSLGSTEIAGMDSPRASMETLTSQHHQQSYMSSTETLTNVKNGPTILVVTQAAQVGPRGGKKKRAPAPPPPPPTTSKTGTTTDDLSSGSGSSPSLSKSSGKALTDNDHDNEPEPVPSLTNANESLASIDSSVASSLTSVVTELECDTCNDTGESLSEADIVVSVDAEPSVNTVCEQPKLRPSSFSSTPLSANSEDTHTDSEPVAQEVDSATVDIAPIKTNTAPSADHRIGSVATSSTSTPKAKAVDGEAFQANQQPNRALYPTFIAPPPPETTPPPSPLDGALIMQSNDSIEVEAFPALDLDPDPDDLDPTPDPEHVNKEGGSSFNIVHSRTGSHTSSTGSIGRTSITTLDDINQCFELTISAGEEAIRKDEEAEYKNEMAQFVEKMGVMTAEIHEGSPDDSELDDEMTESPRESIVSDTGSVIRHGSDITSEDSVPIADEGVVHTELSEQLKQPIGDVTHRDRDTEPSEIDVLDELNNAVAGSLSDSVSVKDMPHTETEIAVNAIPDNKSTSKDIAEVSKPNMDANKRNDKEADSDSDIATEDETQGEDVPKKKEPEEFVFTKEDLSNVYALRLSYNKPETEQDTQEDKPKRNEAYKELYKELHVRRRSGEHKEPPPVRPKSAIVQLRAVPEGSVRGIQGGVRNRRSQFDVPCSEDEIDCMLEEKSISQIALPATRETVLKTSKDPTGAASTPLEDTNKISTVDKPNPFANMSPKIEVGKPRSESDPAAYSSVRQAIKQQSASNVYTAKPMVIVESDTVTQAPSTGKSEQQKVLQAQYDQLQAQFLLWQTQLQQNQAILAHQNVIPSEQNPQVNAIQQQMAIQQKMMKKIQQNMNALKPPSKSTIEEKSNGKPVTEVKEVPVIKEKKVEVVNSAPSPAPGPPPAPPPVPDVVQVPVVTKATVKAPPKVAKPPSSMTATNPWDPKSFQKVQLKPASKRSVTSKKFEPQLDPREHLMIAIKNHKGADSMNQVPAKRTSFTIEIK